MSKDHFVKQDYNGIYHDAAALAADTYSAVQDFGVAGGCPQFHRVLDVGALGTGASLVWVLYQSTDNSSFTEIARMNITAAGRYVFRLDNTMVENRYFKTHKDVTLGSAASIAVTEFDFIEET